MSQDQTKLMNHFNYLILNKGSVTGETEHISDWRNRTY